MNAVFRISLVILVAVVLSACAASNQIDRIQDRAQDVGLTALEKAFEKLDKARADLVKRATAEYERRKVKLAVQRLKDDQQMARLKKALSQ